MVSAKTAAGAGAGPAHEYVPHVPARLPSDHARAYPARERPRHRARRGDGRNISAEDPHAHVDADHDEHRGDGVVQVREHVHGPRELRVQRAHHARGDDVAEV
eukprot:31564-Pelagococcus_subviridis.AAC.12